MRSFTSINGQISILKSRGMLFKSVPNAKQILKDKNYYNLINGFKKFFVDSSSTVERYIPNIYFEEVYALFCFDRELRNLFLKYILNIENELRTHIAYEFAKAEGPQAWKDSLSYKTIPVGRNDTVSSLIGQLNDIETKISNIGDTREDMLTHFTNSSEVIPIWAFINTFEFGTLKVFYLNLKHNLREQIANNYYGINNGELRSFLETLNMFRNVCAHENKILSYRIKDLNKRISDTDCHKKLNIEKDLNGYYKRGKNDLFSIVIVFKIMLNKIDFNEFFDSLKKLILKLTSELDVISLNDVLTSIGFPINNGAQKNWDFIKNI